VFDYVWFAERHNWHKFVFHQYPVHIPLHEHCVSIWPKRFVDPPKNRKWIFQPGDRIHPLSSWIIQSTRWCPIVS
jgi:hypothetical protein